MEASADKLLLHLCEDVGQGQGRIQLDDYECGEDSVNEHVEHLLDVIVEGEQDLCVGVWVY